MAVKSYMLLNPKNLPADVVALDAAAAERVARRDLSSLIMTTVDMTICVFIYVYTLLLSCRHKHGQRERERERKREIVSCAISTSSAPPPNTSSAQQQQQQSVMCNRDEFTIRRLAGWSSRSW